MKNKVIKQAFADDGFFICDICGEIFDINKSQQEDIITNGLVHCDECYIDYMEDER